MPIHLTWFINLKRILATDVARPHFKTSYKKIVIPQFSQFN